MQKREHAKAEELLSGEVLYMAVSSKDAVQYNDQSCDCKELVIVTNKQVLIIKHDADGIHLKPTFSYYEQKYDLRICPPSDAVFVFVKAHYSDDGCPNEIKFRFADRYVFLFAVEHAIIITKSISDLFEEDDTTIPDQDESVLFSDEV